MEKIQKVHERKAKRVGRGKGSGKGTTAGRGTKGQKSRSGFNIPRRFEGGQTPLVKRLAKIKGFKSRKIKYDVIDIAKIEKEYKDGEIVNLKTLKEKGLIVEKKPVKILGSNLKKKLKFREVVLNQKLLKIVKSAKEKKDKIEK